MDIFNPSITQVQEKGWILINQDPSLVRLRLGEILMAQVLEITGPDRALMALKDTTISAKTTISLQPGENYLVKVEKVLPEVTLKIIPHTDEKNDQMLSLLRQYLPNKKPMGELLARLFESLPDKSSSPERLRNTIHLLRERLSSLILKPSDSSEPVPVKEYLKQGGTRYESKLASLLSTPPAQLKENMNLLQSDLKWPLIKLEEELTQFLKVEAEGPGRPDAEISNLRTLLNMVSRTLQNIELQQLNTALLKNQDLMFQVQLPLLMSDQRNTADLWVFKNQGEGKGKGQSSGFHLLFLLDLQKIGPLRIDVWIEKQTVRCQIQAEERGIVEFVNMMLPELASGIRQIGLEPWITCAVASREEVKPAMEQTAPGNGQSLIDVIT